MTNNGKAHNFICQTKPWANNSNGVWLASTVSLLRNIEKFKFPGKLSTESKKQILALIDKGPLEIEGLQKPLFVKAEDASLLEKEYLSEHFLSTTNYQAAEAGEGFILDETGEFLGQVNIENHLKFLLIDSKGDLENAWNRLVKIESAMGKLWSYSFSQKFGFLTADDTQCGTALHATVFLQLPGLIHTGAIDDFLEANTDESVNITGIHANPTEIIGDILMIQNNYTLGLSEENIISTVRSLTTKIVAEENRARATIKVEQTPAIKDKVSRGYAILLHSYQIEAVEALNAISLLKLGVEMGWISGVSAGELNSLFFTCRRAHLLNQYPDKIPQEEITHKRAEFIHKALKKIKLEI